MAGTQQSVELKLALDQEQQKSKKLEDSMRKLDDEMQRTDELLYQMIPKSVADRLRNGENPVDTCQVFSFLSFLKILFDTNLQIYLAYVYHLKVKSINNVKRIWKHEMKTNSC